MARLVLSRSTPITLAEAAALPVGARVDNGAHGGRVELVVPGRDLAALLAAAVALGRAVPDGRLDPHDLPDLTAPPKAEPARIAGRPAEEAAPPPQALPATSWELLDQGQVEDALAAFAHDGLDPDGRERVRQLFASTDPQEVALACRIAQAAEWRSYVTTMKRVLHHGDVRVRVAAVRAIGALAGPSMAWQLEKLAHDPSPEVRQAVAEAVAAIEGRQG